MLRTLACVILVLTLASTMVGCRAVLDYQVLREWDPEWDPGGGTGMDLLVAETATKEEVLALATYLREEYSDGRIVIFIFDSREAWAARETETRTGKMPSNYSDEEYWKHHLVNIIRNPTTGYDEIEWVAKGRSY